MTQMASITVCNSTVSASSRVRQTDDVKGNNSHFKFLTEKCQDMFCWFNLCSEGFGGFCFDPSLSSPPSDAYTFS
jgi:hypothetical protein